LERRPYPVVEDIPILDIRGVGRVVIEIRLLAGNEVEDAGSCGVADAIRPALRSKKIRSPPLMSQPVTWVCGVRELP
jgi:hypothetical protein